jgi:hypothetical protein
LVQRGTTDDEKNTNTRITMGRRQIQVQKGKIDGDRHQRSHYGTHPDKKGTIEETDIKTSIMGHR